MSILAALKIFCDLTLPASAASVVIPWFSLIPGNYLPSMLCCASGILLASLLRKRAAVRFLGAGPCLGALAFCGGWVDAVVVIPMVAYCLWFIAGGQLTVSYDEYREFFKTGAIFHGACLFFASVNMDWLSMLPYALLYFVGAVFLLRNLRLGASGSGRHMALNLLSFTMTVALGVALCAAVYTLLCLLRYPAVAVYFGVMDVLLEATRWIVYLFGDILSCVAAFFLSLLYRSRGEQLNVDGFGNGEGQMKPQPEIEPNETVNAIAGLILILLVAGAMVFLARRAAKLMKRRREGQGRRITTQRIRVTGDSRGGKVTGNRARVRSVYRRFLRLVTERGGEIRSDHTSEDVLHLASLVADGQECAALREVYLSARYDTVREVTGEQVKKARSIYGRLKGDGR